MRTVETDASRGPQIGLGAGQFALLLGFLIVLAFPDVVLGWRTFFHRDYGIFGYPLAFHHQQSFAQGELPLWNSLNHCGVPFLAQWNAMVLYPFTVLYLFLPLSWALGIFCLAHLFWGGLGMYWLVRDWTANHTAACVGGLAFALNGLMLSSLKWPNNIAALAWMPWVIWAVLAGCRHGSRTLVIACLFGAVQMLTGGPEIILFTWAIVGLLILAELLTAFAKAKHPKVPPNPPGRNPQPAPPAVLSLPALGAPASLPAIALASKTQDTRGQGCRRSRGPSVIMRIAAAPPILFAVRFAMIIVLVAGLAAIQLLPFFELLRASQRSDPFLDTSWAMPLSGLANFLVPLFGTFPSHQGVHAQPDQFWISSYYPGIFVLLLLPFAFWVQPRGKVFLLAGMALVSLILALGPAGLLFTWFLQFVPGANILRFPIKFVVPVLFILPLLAGLGAAALMDRQKAPANPDQKFSPRKVSMTIYWVAAVLFTFILLITVWDQMAGAPSEGNSFVLWNAAGRCVVLALLVVLLGRSLLAQQAKHALFWFLSIFFVHWADILTHAPRLAPTVASWAYDPQFVRQELKMSPAPALGHSRAMISPWAEYRMNHLALTNAETDFLYSRLALFANANLIDQLPKTDGFFSLSIKEEHRVRHLIYGSTNPPPVPLRNFLAVSQITAPGKLIEWSPQTNHLPFITAGQRPVFADGPTTLRAMMDPQFAPREIVFIDPIDREFVTVTNSTQAAVRLTLFQNHNIQAEVTSPEPAWIVISQAYYKPWKAYINGSPTRIFRANHGFQAIQIPAGTHSIRWVYEDKAFRLGAFISVGSLLVCAVLWFRGSRQASHPA